MWPFVRSRWNSKAQKAAAIATSLVWLLSSPGGAQPLQSGVQVSDGTRYLVEGDALRSVSSQHGLGRIADSPEVTAIYQAGASWQGAFLVVTPSGLSRAVAEPDGLAFEEILPGTGLVVTPWGDDYLVASSDSSRLTLVTSTHTRDFTFLGDLAQDTVLGQAWAVNKRLALSGSTANLIDGLLASVSVIDERQALIGSEKGYFLLRQGDSPVLRPLTLPFSLVGATLAVGASRSVLWNTASSQALDLDGADTLALPFAPELGLQILSTGDLMIANAKSLAIIAKGGNHHQFVAPAGLTASSFADWKAVADDKALRVVSQEDKQPWARNFDFAGSISEQALPAGKIHALLTPAVGSTLLFVDTSLDEPKIDEDGKPVTDLQTRKPATLQVRGHHIYTLDNQGRWSLIVEEPRAGLVGPLEQVGDRVVYATQTEPEHQAGQELPLDRLYPYPAVILTGRSLSDPKDVWTYQKPRGDTPSKGRLPESAWPLLAKGGPLLLTSEDTRLLALDPLSGELLWASPKLPMDDSSPLMLNWPGHGDKPAQLGLVASKSTGKALLLVDPASGQLVDSLTLSAAFFWDKWRHLLGVLIVCAALAYYIYAAGKRNLFIRKIAGLRALDEAVGRATEMGKPVLYVVGLADVDDIQTMASLSILSHVARKTAEYDTPIITTTPRAVVYSTAHEIVRDAFSVAGRPDAFASDSVRYISDDQFGYTAGVDGIMVREKPAANFYIGNFYAESLILAETGFATGSIQIAGTAQPSQIPFFVAACDYTLIGEELFAASAYLSQDPLQVGSLRGQDVGKMIVMILLVVCSILVSMGIDMQAVGAWLGVNLV